MKLTLGDKSGTAIPILLTQKSQWPKTQARLSLAARAYAKAAGFEAAPGAWLLAPGADGALSCVVFARDETDAAPNPFLFGKLAGALPPGRYALSAGDGEANQGLSAAALSFLLSSYRFDHYKSATEPRPVLETPPGVDRADIERIANAVAMGRDLINTPANDMGPAALELAAEKLAQAYGADYRVIAGEALLNENFPLIHAVGKAADEAPRLVELSWNDPQARLRATFVGKGVCFDTGGLDLKPGAAMLLMKKDMAGAATVLALARMIMDAQLPISFRALLPIVENSVSARAFRPGDVYPSRKGLNVEIGNTDAEGRLILADALTAAGEQDCDLLLDFATLTGAARTALGPDLPAFFTEDDALAAEIARAAEAVNDPVWRLPLWTPYDDQLKSKIADVNNAGGGAFAGAIMAALFLRRFVRTPRQWAHFDIYGWNPTTKPGRPEGGEIQTARLAFELLRQRIQLQSHIQETK